MKKDLGALDFGGNTNTLLPSRSYCQKEMRTIEKASI